MHVAICGALAVAGLAPSNAIATEAMISPSDCCAELEERVAELEASVLKKGTRQVEVTLGGTVSNAVLFWNDGKDSDAYIVGNDNDGTSFEFNGEVGNINDSAWSAGLTVEVGVPNEASSEVNQIDPEGKIGLEINESHIWIKNDWLGQLAWGTIGGGRDVDDATEFDLSETNMVAFSSVEDVGGNFFLRRAGDGLTPVVWADLIDHLPGIDGREVRYDTPNMRGWAGWAEVKHGPQWEVDLAYGDPATLEELEEDQKDQDNETPRRPNLIKGFQTAGAISYQVVDDDPDLPNNRVVAGSVSMLHEATGLNLTLAGGVRVFTEPVALNDGTQRKLQDASFFYAKAGLLKDIIGAGHTAFYAEYGKWNDFLGRDADADAVAGLAGIDAEEVCLPGEACLVSQSEATIWGFGAVQHIDSAEMDLYLGFRLYRPNIDLVDQAGARTSVADLEDFATILSGAIMEF